MYKTYTNDYVIDGQALTRTTLRPKVKEDAHGRHTRLAKQGSVNHARVKHISDTEYEVQSQRRTYDDKPVETYKVVWTGAAWLCQCAFGSYRPGVECTHVARVLEYAKRNKLTLGDLTPGNLLSESEQVTEQWIARGRAARAKRTEWEEDV